MSTSPISLITSKDLPANKIRAVAEQFASVLVSQMFGEMEKSVVKSSVIPQSSAENWYRQWLMNMYSQEATEKQLKPLVNMIASQLASSSYKR